MSRKRNKGNDQFDYRFYLKSKYGIDIPTNPDTGDHIIYRIEFPDGKLFFGVCTCLRTRRSYHVSARTRVGYALRAADGRETWEVMGRFKTRSEAAALADKLVEKTKADDPEIGFNQAWQTLRREAILRHSSKPLSEFVGKEHDPYGRSQRSHS